MARMAWMLAVLLVACGGAGSESELFGVDEARDAGRDGAGGSDSGTEDDGGEGGSGGGAACVPGQSVACVGPGGCQGGQACRQDGAGFEPCECSTGDGGSGGSGGAPDDAGPDAPAYACNTPQQCWCRINPTDQPCEYYPGYPRAYVECKGLPLGCVEAWPDGLTCCQ